MQPSSAPRCRHDAQIKAKVLAACNEPGASIAAVALAHGLNANLVHKWRHGRGLKRAGIATSPSVAASTPAMATPLLSADAGFLPIEMSAPAHASNTGSAARGDTAAPVEPTIDIELRRGPASLGVRWPVSACGDCAAWLREVTAGLGVIASFQQIDTVAVAFRFLKATKFLNRKTLQRGAIGQGRYKPSGLESTARPIFSGCAIATFGGDLTRCARHFGIAEGLQRSDQTPP